MTSLWFVRRNLMLSLIFQVLEVSRSASEVEIRQSYLKKVGTQVRARLVIGAYGSILTNFVKVQCASGVRG